MSYKNKGYIYAKRKFSSLLFTLIHYKSIVSEELFVTFLFSLFTAPSEPPRNLNVTVSSSTAILVQFLPVPPQAANGIIQGYHIIYRESNLPKAHAKEKVLNSTRYTIDQLKFYTQYTVYVKAFTQVGDGPRTNEESVKTLESGK